MVGKCHLERAQLFVGDQERHWMVLVLETEGYDRCGDH